MKVDVVCVDCGDSEVFYGSSEHEIKEKIILEGWVDTRQGDLCSDCWMCKLETGVSSKDLVF